MDVGSAKWAHHMIGRKRKSHQGSAFAAGHIPAVYIDGVAAVITDHFPGAGHGVHLASASAAKMAVGRLRLDLVILALSLIHI